jgi:hypothetical protein
MLWHNLEQHAYPYDAYGNVGENININCGMKELPASQQFPAWSVD